jgi:hypothetical protein
MTKAVVLFLCLAMLVQVIRPLGFPGLRRRSDAWKLAVAAIGIVSVLALVRLD